MPSRERQGRTETQEKARWPELRVEWCRYKPRNTENSPEARRHSWHGLSLRASRRGRPCSHLDLGLLASRAVREYIFVVLSHPVCGTLFWGPQDTPALFPIPDDGCCDCPRRPSQEEQRLHPDALARRRRPCISLLGILEGEGCGF